MLVQQGFKIISGFGLGIGSSIINGALDEIVNSKYKHIDEHLCLRPFPQTTQAGKSLPDLWQDYRIKMIGESGIAIFLFGNKIKKGENKNTTVIADGMLKEFEIAKRNSEIIIPIGSTGWAAQKIFKEVESEIDKYPYLSEYLDILRSCTDSNELIKTICAIVNKQQPY